MSIRIVNISRPPRMVDVELATTQTVATSGLVRQNDGSLERKREIAQSVKIPAGGSVGGFTPTAVDSSSVRAAVRAKTIAIVNE